MATEQLVAVAADNERTSAPLETDVEEAGIALVQDEGPEQQPLAEVTATTSSPEAPIPTSNEPVELPNAVGEAEAERSAVLTAENVPSGVIKTEPLANEAGDEGAVEHPQIVLVPEMGEEKPTPTGADGSTPITVVPMNASREKGAGDDGAGPVIGQTATLGGGDSTVALDGGVPVVSEHLREIVEEEMVVSASADQEGEDISALPAKIYSVAASTSEEGALIAADAVGNDRSPPSVEEVQESGSEVAEGLTVSCGETGAPAPSVLDSTSTVADKVLGAKGGEQTAAVVKDAATEDAVEVSLMTQSLITL